MTSLWAVTPSTDINAALVIPSISTTKVELGSGSGFPPGGAITMELAANTKTRTPNNANITFRFIVSPPPVYQEFGNVYSAPPWHIDSNGIQIKIDFKQKDQFDS
jgi:hypothetical protein